MHINKRWGLFPFQFIPWFFHFGMCIARFLYSYLDDLLKNLGKTTAQECKKFTLRYPLDKSVSNRQVLGKPIALTSGKWFIRWIALSTFWTTGARLMYIAQTHLWLSSLLRHVSVADGAKSQQNHWTSSNLWGDFIQRRHKGPGAWISPGNHEHDPWLLWGQT